MKANIEILAGLEKLKRKYELEKYLLRSSKANESEKYILSQIKEID